MSVLENHYSVITSLQFSLKSNTLYSAGRDNIVTVWNLHNNNKEKTIPVYEVNIRRMNCSFSGFIAVPNSRSTNKFKWQYAGYFYVASLQDI